jgi:hypothetical protein
MTDKLVELANELDQDPSLQSRYKENPRQTMIDFGVAIEDVDLILSNDTAAIKDRLEMSGMKAFTIISKSK